jgi:hypothetical protein
VGDIQATYQKRPCCISERPSVEAGLATISHVMATTKDISATMPTNIARRSVSIRSAVAKKIVNEAALNDRQEALNAATATQPTFRRRVVGQSLSSPEDQPQDKNDSSNSPVRRGVKTEIGESSRIPRESTVPYAGLKPARKRKRPSDSETTHSPLPPSSLDNTSRRLPLVPAKKPAGEKAHQVHS